VHAVVSFREVAFGPEIVAALVLALAALGEWLHSRRVARIAHLAFGPSRKPALWARFAPHVRVLAAAAAAWGFATLLAIEPKRYSTEGKDATGEPEGRIVLVLDVSPSMRLVDAGPEKKDSRMLRARRLMESFFDRAPIDQNTVSVIAVYNGAKPVVVDTRDIEVIRNILGDLPMHFAFDAGKTRLLDGLEEAAKLARPWPPRSTTLILLSDGDSVPTTGMPRMPASIRSVLVVGVGDPKSGKFIDGRHSRQEVALLKQIAARLGGAFHDGNEKQLASDLIAAAMGRDDESVFERLTRREYALLALAIGAALLALLPLLLHAFGSAWRPGVETRPSLLRRAAAAAPRKFSTRARPRAPDAPPVDVA
jgi:Ca-activated chloride channel family protein